MLAGRIEVREDGNWDDFDGRVAPKSRAGIRSVPIAASLRAHLDAHLKWTKRKGGDLIFGRTKSDPFTPSFVQDTADDAWETAKLERITLHEGRHSFGTFLDHAPDITEARASRYMGHGDGRVQARYRHLLDEQVAKDAAAIEKYLSGGRSGKVVPMPTGALPHS